MSESMQSAEITLIHKKDKNPQQCGSYRPVSLINVDAKILAKILATKLEAWGFLRVGLLQIMFVGYCICYGGQGIALNPR